jgi:hypothetical protein
MLEMLAPTLWKWLREASSGLTAGCLGHRLKFKPRERGPWRMRDLRNWTFLPAQGASAQCPPFLNWREDSDGYLLSNPRCSMKYCKFFTIAHCSMAQLIIIIMQSYLFRHAPQQTYHVYYERSGHLSLCRHKHNHFTCLRFHSRITFNNSIRLQVALQSDVLHQCLF